MPSLSSKLAFLAQAGFIISILILIIGIVKLLSFGGNPGIQVIENHKPFGYAFGITLGVSVFLAVAATIINFRARFK